MNRLSFISTLLLSALLAAVALAPCAFPQAKKSSSGEEFFIISSVDTSKSQVLLKRPTEVTLLMKVNDQTTYLDATNKPLHLADLHAGDTVWVISSGSTPGGPVAIRIRKGPMTVAELHQHFLDYPVIK